MFLIHQFETLFATQFVLNFSICNIYLLLKMDAVPSRVFVRTGTNSL